MVTLPQKLCHMVTLPHFEKLRGDVGIGVGKCGERCGKVCWESAFVEGGSVEGGVRKCVLQSTVAKYLGIFFDDKLSWAHHVLCFYAKRFPKRQVFSTKFGITFKSKKLPVSLYYSFIYPHLLYGKPILT